jgi:hypothetical protein
VGSSDQANNHALYTTGSPGGPYTTVPLDTSTGHSGITGFGLDLDSTVTPNFAYNLVPASGSTSLLWATPPPATPSLIEQASFSGTGSCARLRVAPGNTIHVVAFDPLTATSSAWRHFIHPAGGSWTVHQISVTGQGVTGNFTNFIDLNGSGNPAIVYTNLVTPGNLNSSQLVWATYLSGVWTTSVIPTPTGALQPAFAFDAGGFAHVVYTEASQQAVGYATNASGTWVVTTIATIPSGSVEPCTAIAIDQATGRIHVVFATSTQGLQYLGMKSGGSWVPLSFDPTVVANTPSIAVDGFSRTHVAYYDTVNKKLKIVSGTP